MMNVTNKSKRPISVPLPGGKKLFLGPGRTGQINPKAASHPPLVELVEAGDLEIDDTARQPNKMSDADSVTGSQSTGPTSHIRRTGDR